MASNDNSTGGLFLTLGLDIAELETGFIAAEDTVKQNLARLNRESNLIRLRTQVELGNLDEAADAAQILAIRENALNQQMAIQRDRIRLAEAALRDLISRHGEEAVISQRAAMALERERLNLQNLERQLQELNSTADESNDGLESTVEVFGEFPGGAALATAALTALSAGIMTAATASNDLIEKFRELQTQAYELNLPVDETRKFLQQMQLGGGDIGDFEGYIRGITDAYVKGEYDDPEFIALRKYGAEITDATGRLKDFKDITEEVYQAWKKAEEAGEGIEFLQLTGGESGIRDAIQFFQRYEEAKEDAAKIFNMPVNTEELHEADRSLGLMTAQFEELKNAAADIFTPSAISTTRELFELFHDGTEFLVENKDEFQRWGFIAEETLHTVLESLKELHEVISDVDIEDNSFLGNLKNAAKNAAKNSIENVVLGTPFKFLKDFGAFDGILERAEKRQNEYNNGKSLQARIEEEKAFQAEIKALEALSDKNPLNQYDWKRVNALREELEDLNIELDFGDDPYQKAIAENDLWLQRELKQKNYLSEDEENALRELHAAKSEQIERDKEDRIAEIRKAANAEFQNDMEKRFAKIDEEREKAIQAGMEEAEANEIAEKRKTQAITALQEEAASKIREIWGTELDNRLAQIETERQAWIQKGVSESYATKLAEAQKAQVIQEFNDNVVSKVNSIWQTELQNRLDQIEKEKQAWIQKGLDEVKATEWAEQAKADARKNAAMSVLKSQLEEYRAFREGGFRGLRDYQLNQLYKAGITDEDLQMTGGQLQTFQEAKKLSEASLLPNLMSDSEWREYHDLTKPDYSRITISNYPQSGEARIWSDNPQQQMQLPLDYQDVGVNQEMAGLNTNLIELSTKLGDLSASQQAWAELSSKLSDLNVTLTDFSKRQPETYGSDGRNQNATRLQQPVNSTISVQIGEAHAWDSEHIQELTEKVADQIKPAIESALNSNSNSY